MFLGKNYYHYCMRSDSIMSNRNEDVIKSQIFFRLIEAYCKKQKDRIPNIMEQIKMYEYYIMLLRNTEKIVWYKNGILFPFDKIDQDDRVVIYSVGRFGYELKKLMEE